ncbi:hypothetical protein MMC12_003856 [Toensbergia leucococca]|nr:hypothetical protein [Toensbergia leucococca]
MSDISPTITTGRPRSEEPLHLPEDPTTNHTPSKEPSPEEPLSETMLQESLFKQSILDTTTNRWIPLPKGLLLCRDPSTWSLPTGPVPTWLESLESHSLVQNAGIQAQKRRAGTRRADEHIWEADSDVRPGDLEDPESSRGGGL